MDVERLVAVLDTARERGHLGPGPVATHVAHSAALARLIGDEPGPFLDLGSGGGVPGLVLAEAWPDVRGVLLDASERKCRFLRGALDELELAARVSVQCGRAEELARVSELREAFSLVVARGFARPAITAECGVPFLAPGGRFVVSEPPSADAEQRWPSDGLARLGMARTAVLREGETGAVVLTRPEPLADRWPRRSGVPGKRPLW
jgi:16S rRNA (guanine527-N7)-methyltransferase